MPSSIVFSGVSYAFDHSLAPLLRDLDLTIPAARVSSDATAPANRPCCG